MNSKEANSPTSVGLIDGTQRKQGMAQTYGVGRIWIALAVLFLAVSIGLSGYIIYLKVVEKQPVEPGSKEYIIVTYPTYFKTPVEQRIFEEEYYKENTVNTAIEAEPVFNVPELNSCFFSCSPAYPTGNNSFNQNNRARRAVVKSPLMEWLTVYKTIHLMSKRDVNTTLSNPINHGCCISRLFFTSPDTAISVNNINVTLVTIDNKRQYFPTQQCEHAVGCTGCGCAQETNYYTAVVINPQFPGNSNLQYILDTIKIRGCCKCFNNRKPPALSSLP